MIVKILKGAKSPAGSFNGVRYNIHKVDIDKGELMAARNFGALDGIKEVQPQDYVNYLEAWSKRNTRIQQPQFHIVISAKGREADKHELAELAERWLTGMGYGTNPYLLIYHKDTANNHIHIVSSRVGPDGKKIDDSFEHKRAYQVLHQLTGVAPEQSLNEDVSQALAYRFATRAQFMMLLEAKGDSLKLENAHYHVFKYGTSVGKVPLREIDQRTQGYEPDKKRIAQIRALIYKYRNDYSPLIYPVHEILPGNREGKFQGYQSELSEFLRVKFGLVFLFHGKEGKPPYGYTMIDHTNKSVYKGGLVMPLATLIAPLLATVLSEIKPEAPAPTAIPEVDIFVEDPVVARTEELPVLANEPTVTLPEICEAAVYIPPLRIDIAADIDDEQILGRNRRRKRQARTNTR